MSLYDATRPDEDCAAIAPLLPQIELICTTLFEKLFLTIGVSLAVVDDGMDDDETTSIEARRIRSAQQTVCLGIVHWYVDTCLGFLEMMDQCGFTPADPWATDYLDFAQGIVGDADDEERWVLREELGVDLHATRLRVDALRTAIREAQR